MDETVDTRCRGRSDHRLRAGDITSLKTCTRRRVDDPGDVDDRVTPRAQIQQTLGLVQRTIDPDQSVLFGPG